MLLIYFIPLLQLACARNTRPNFDFKKYHSFDEYVAYMKDVAEAYPDFVRLQIIGRTHEGRPLLALKIGNPVEATNKRIVWIDGGNHAREWPAFHTAAYFINELVTKYGKDPEITDYIDKLNFYIFPVLNPDGFEFSRTSDLALIRHWRKNRAPENCTGSILFRKNLCCEGVDLNRNYDFDFRQTIVPFNNPCSDEFQGPHPFSEPESRAVRDFITSDELWGKTDAVISMHTHGQLIILPYNHRKRTYPKDYADLVDVAERVRDAIKAFTGRVYRVGTAADMLGPATGGATDWIKRNTPTKYVYVIELPPEFTMWFAFQVKPHWLLPTAIETWKGVQVIIDQVLIDNDL